MHFPGVGEGFPGAAFRPTTSRARSASPTAISGFTLVEILVVIVILGLVAGLAVALVDPGERDVSAREARRFAGALEYAAARAQWRNEMLGVSTDGRTVRYWRRDVANDRWRVVEDDDVLRAHALPDMFDAMALRYAGRSVPGNAIVPLRASGRNEPFAFVLATPRFRTTVALDPLNRVSIAGPAPNDS
jgi:general secretion pathway protein H